MIELTKEEVQAILNSLGEIPSKYVLGLIKFFNNKLCQEKSTLKTTQENSTPMSDTLVGES